MKKKQIADNHYMQVALQQAVKAAQQDEVPIGAVIVDPHGVIIARAYNKVEQRNTQTAHAELLAIEKAGKKIGDWRLLGCWLYVTLEPCKMCMSLIRLSRLEGVVYGAQSPLFGYQLDNKESDRVYKKDVHVISGMCADEAAQLLKVFFKEKRKKHG